MTDHRSQADATSAKPGGRLAEMVAADHEAPRGGVSAASWIKVLVLAGGFLWLTGWQYPKLIRMWLNDPNWSHGFIIPLFSLFLLYQRWGEIAAAGRRSARIGLPIFVAGILAMLLAIYPVKNYWLSQLSMTVILLGMVLYLAGAEVAKLTWVPIFYLVLAMPVPETLYVKIAYPLQEVAAYASAAFLRLFGAGVEVTASRMEVVGHSGEVYGLTVAEACSGIRSLMAFVALGVAMAYIARRPVWQRLVLIASILPVTVFCNVLRVTGTCAMYVIDRPVLGQDFMHKFMGMAMLIPAGLIFLLLSWLLNRLFVEEDASPAEAGTAASGSGSA